MNVRTLAAAITLAGVTTGASAYDPELVVVRGGTVITVSGEPIEGGVIVIEDGVITAVGPAIDFPASAEVIDARGQFVMPGIVIPSTRLGLSRYQRNGVNANLSASAEIYPASMDNTPWLEAGVVAVAYMPAGFGMPGAASVYLTADPFEDDGQSELLDASAYQRVTLTNPRRDKKTLREAITKARAEIKKVEDARAKWEEEQKKKAEAEEAKKKEAEKQEGEEPENGENGEEKKDKPEGARRGAEGDTPENGGDESAEASEDEPKEFEPPEIDATLKPIVNLLQGGEGALVVELDSADDVEHLLNVLEELDLMPSDEEAEEGKETKPEIRIALTNAPSSFHYVVSKVAEFGGTVRMPVGTGTMPLTATRYNLAGELDLLGAELSFTPDNNSATALRSYRDHIAMLIRDGLSREAALRAMTTNPATELGLSERMGTIETGKTADLAFFDGDPLDPASRAVRVLIEGETVWTRDQEDDR